MYTLHCILSLNWKPIFFMLHLHLLDYKYGVYLQAKIDSKVSFCKRNTFIVGESVRRSTVNLQLDIFVPIMVLKHSVEVNHFFRDVVIIIVTIISVIITINLFAICIENATCKPVTAY